MSFRSVVTTLFVKIKVSSSPVSATRLVKRSEPPSHSNAHCLSDLQISPEYFCRSPDHLGCTPERTSRGRQAMDDDASYAAVTMIQTNVRAHQIRKRKQKDRGSNGAPSAPDTPPTPVCSTDETAAVRTEELDGWKLRGALSIALLFALMFVYVYRPIVWAVNVPSSFIASFQRWILRPVFRRLGFASEGAD